MAIPGLCAATNIRKYYCKNYFLTFKCYCFPTRAAVFLLPRSFRSMASMTDGKKRDHVGGGGGGGGGGGVVVVFIETPEPDRPPSVQLLGQTINVSIIECLSKKAVVWGALKILWLVIMPPLTPPLPPLASRSFPPLWRRLSSSLAAL